MPFPTEIQELLKIEIPIIQAGMVWTSGWKLAAAVSSSGALGLIGAGSMKPELLREHIQKARTATSKSVGVNIPLLRGDAKNLIETALEEGIFIFFTSAGNPALYTRELIERGCKVVHVVPSPRLAKKAEAAGVHAIVAEGVEAGGHNGKEEIATFPLIPEVVSNVTIPVIAAGGIADGRGIAAAFCLGAKGVQLGTRFAATIEASCHPNFKEAIVRSSSADTHLVLRKIGNSRVIRNEWSETVENLEFSGADQETLKNALGSKRERLGIFEGDLQNGQLEAGQCVGIIQDLPSASELVVRLWKQTKEVIQSLSEF
ncbi:MAG: nitronate monooxygenase [bacterium]|nr:nitronate monooxygenase [bacterium]